MNNQEKGVIINQEGDSFIIKFNDGRELPWPKKNINWVIKEGEIVKVTVSPQVLENDFQEDQAKNLLKTIFQTNNA
ncbi:MAG: hypothetical protein WC473_03340 [Patescibacteria group bacterium]